MPTMSQQNGEKVAEDKKKPKAVALLSGGLDSSLAVRMMLHQGIDVEAVAIKTPFCDFDCGKGCGHRVKEVADELGIKLKTVYFGEEYLRMLKNPKHGYGSGMNPCIDCRGMMYNAAKEHMKRTSADFVITGEVLFQRPMSQNNRALHIIEKETGMECKVLRPLSAKHLPATEAENMGLIKREKMGDIKGRSRKGQLALAKHFGISRHAKFVVGRNKDENEVIKALATNGDLIMEVKDYVGPTCILRCKNYDDSLLAKCAAIAARYSDAPRDYLSKVSIIVDSKK